MDKEQHKEQIIHDMYLTWRHDYGLLKENSFVWGSGMTEPERQGLFRSMSQIFEHHIEPILKERDEFMNGERIPLPKNEAHARAMLIIAQHYLDNK